MEDQRDTLNEIGLIITTLTITIDLQLGCLQMILPRLSRKELTITKDNGQPHSFASSRVLPKRR